MTDNIIVEFDNVSKNYIDKNVIENINFKVKKGEFFILVGPSGSGKTTSLKMINSLVSASSGDIYFKGKNIKDYNLSKMRMEIGYVLQQIALFPNMTVKENIELIPELLSWSKDKKNKLAYDLLKQVDLDPDKYISRYPNELSGGEQQRIGILRAIAASPELILMDEPFSALDPISRESLQELILHIHEELQTTIIFVTHNMQEALKLGDRIAIMNKGQIVQCDTPKNIIENPANEFVEDFFKETNSINDFNNTPLGDFIDKKDLLDIIPDSKVQVGINTPMKDIFKELSSIKEVNIESDNDLIGSISQELIFKHLSK